MGIPSYYKNLIQNYPEIIIQNTSFNQTIDHLFLDLNCLIHPCCKDKTNEKESFECILDKINDVFKLQMFKHYFILLLMVQHQDQNGQQRQRRLKSSQEK